MPRLRGDGVMEGTATTFPVRFLKGMLGRGNRPKNPWYFGGEGEVGFDATSLRVKGKHAEVLWGGEFKEHAIALSSLRNASREGTKLRVEIFDDEAAQRGREVVFWANDESAAAEIFARLPKVQTEEYATKTRERGEFDARLKARTPRVYVTYIVFALALAALVEPFIARAAFAGKAGSNAILAGAAGLLAIWIAGPTAERAYGNGTFLGLCFLAAFAGALASTLGLGSPVTSAATGLVYGLLGAYLAYGLKGANLVPKTVAGDLKGGGGFLLVMNVLAGIFGQLDYAAAAIGLAAGVVSGYALGRPLDAPGRQAK